MKILTEKIKRMKRNHETMSFRVESYTAMQTTLTAEGTATSGFVKCFWASRNPSAELCRKRMKILRVLI